MSKDVQCRCHPSSPFLWHVNRNPSSFVTELAFTGRTSQAATEHVESQRALGKEVGTIEGLSKKAEDAILRFRQASVYLRAKVSK